MSITPSAEQQSAIDFIVANKNRHVLLTGRAGAGKSTIVNLLAQRVPLFKSATTGRAAINIGGVTVDTLFSMKRDPYECRNPKTLQYNMSAVPDRIVIDEASMIGAKMADYLYKQADAFGKQLILVGDFAQARPVKDDLAMSSELFLSAGMVKLTECHRQADLEFLDALDSLRRGEPSDAASALFGSRIVQAPDECELRMYATHNEVDRYNNAELAKIRGRSVILDASVADRRATDFAKKYPLTPERKKTMLDSSPLATGLPLKVGARVMLTSNVYDSDDFQDRKPVFVNGDCGTVEEISVLEGSNGPMSLRDATCPKLGQTAPQLSIMSITIRLDRTGECVDITKTSIEIKDVRGNTEFELTGWPIALGWAVTMHKAQGATLSSSFVHMPSIMHMPLEGRHGLAYVALSRTRRLADLHLSHWVPEAVYCDPALRPFV